MEDETERMGRVHVHTTAGGMLPAPARNWLPLSLCLLGGCASVHIEGNADDVRVERGFGVLSVEITPRQKSVVARTTGVGVIRTWEGLAVGYYDGVVAALGADDCRIIVWAEDRSDINRLDSLVDDPRQICVVTNEEEQ